MSLLQNLALRPNQGPSLLGIAVRYFFGRAVEEDRQLFQGLAWATWERLAEALQRGFAQLQQALTEHGQELELRLDELLAYVMQIHGAVLDIREERRRQGDRYRDLYETVLDVQRRMDLLAQQGPQDSLAVHCDAERQLLKGVLARYRALAPAQQQQMAALLQTVAGLQRQVGDVDEAEKSYATLTTILTDRKVLAEAHYHAYRAALDRHDWARALASYRQAAALDPESWTEKRLRAEMGEVLQRIAPDVKAEVQRALAHWRAE